MEREQAIARPREHQIELKALGVATKRLGFCQHRGKTWMPTCVGMTMWKRPLRHMEHLFSGESKVGMTTGGKVSLP